MFSFDITYEAKKAYVVLRVLYFKEPIRSPNKGGLYARQLTTKLRPHRHASKYAKKKVPFTLPQRSGHKA